MKHHWIGLAVLALAIILASIFFGVHLRGKHSCRDFISQEDAQSTFNSDPINYRFLDRDHDGVPCESL